MLGADVLFPFFLSQDLGVAGSHRKAKEAMAGSMGGDLHHIAFVK